MSEEHKDFGKKNGFFSELFQMLKFFGKSLVDILKKGMKEHKRGIIIFFVIVFIGFVLVSYGLLKFSETAFFCGSCHNMKPYIDSWKASSHRNVKCVDCHYKPGFINHLKGKWRDGQVSLVYAISGKIPPRSHAQIYDESCLQCHKKETLNTPILFKNVVFNHKNHLDQMIRGMNLRCTTCHGQMVQGEHIVVNEVECFTCHFYSAGVDQEKKDAYSKCTACHFETKGELKVADFIFNHKGYVKRGITCEKCHTNVIKGDGHLKENVCLQCHEKREFLETQYKPEYLHKIHVTEYKVECITCHSVIKHEIVKPHYRSTVLNECTQCHKAQDHHDDVVNMYIGKGAKFVEDTPNRKASLNMDCSMCHDANRDKSSIPAKCKGCHGNFTDGMVERWNKILKEKLDDLNKDINHTKSVIAGKKIPSKLSKKVDEALYNYSFLVNGHGTHNIIYSLKIIDATKNVLKEVRAKANNEPAIYDSFKLSCTYICHGNINERKVPFGSVTFPHEVHVENDEACINCHSKYDNHGKTTLKGCGSCHHGEGMGKVTCQDCHRSEVNMFKGEGVSGLSNMRSTKFGKVKCTDCHVSIKSGQHNLSSIKATCSKCHKKGQYETKVEEWAKQNRELKVKYNKILNELDKEIIAVETKEGKHYVPLRKIHEELTEDIHFLTLGGYNHNFNYSKAIIEKIDKNIEKLKKILADKKAGKIIKLYDM